VNPYLFIVGCARSGTTLLHRLVDAHPLVAIIHETHWITKRFKEPAVTPEMVSEMVEHKRFASLGVGREEFEDLLGEPVSYRRFLGGLFELYAEARSKPLVGDKTPSYVTSIPKLHALWPEARFVHIVRDGRDVCLSVMNWKKAGRIAGRYATWEEDPVSTTALWWERKVRLGRKGGGSLPEGLYHEVRYEDLINHPGRECVRLCEFLGLPNDDAMLRFHEGKTRMDLPDPKRTPKAAWLPVTSGLRCWRAEMPAEDVERFEAAAGDLLKELGYPLATDPKPGALEHAARMRESFASDAGSRGQRLPAGWEA
jgi:Sulfotransferase family